MNEHEKKRFTEVWKALVIEIGGEDAEAMTRAYFERGETVAEIAERHGKAASTVHEKIQRLRGKLAKYGFLPMSWRDRDHTHRRRIR